jgi:hypothetical protein
MAGIKQENYNYKTDDILKIIGANLSLMTCVCIVTFMVCNLHSSYITPIIEDYENGEIIKQEKIVIENTDTIKVIKYKYKF